MDGPARLNVAVVAKCEGDRLWLLSLLSNKVYLPVSYSSVSQLSNSTQSFTHILHCIRKQADEEQQSRHTQISKIPRLLVISDINTEDFIVSSLQSGARNVINLNESATVLRARIDATFKNNAWLMDQLRIPPFIFDGSDQTISRRGQLLSITPIEYRFARYMFENCNREVPKRELMTAVWSSGANANSRRVDTIASRVRAKLILKERYGWLLKKNRGAGFILSSCSAPWCMSTTIERLKC